MKSIQSHSPNTPKITSASNVTDCNGSASEPFSFPVTVYWEDTDAGGVVYHANYLNFLERARSEWLRTFGIGQQTLRERDDIVLAVRDMRLEFLKPARLDDCLQASVTICERRRASLLIGQELFRGRECLLRAEVRIASLTASTFRPCPLPKWLMATPTSGVT